MEETTKSYAMPIAVAIAILLIIGAFVFNSQNAPLSPEGGASTGGLKNKSIDPLDKISPVSTADHLRGAVGAKVSIIEYSDLECPYCKQFHETLSQIYTKYESTGQVAWIFRQLPLESLHQRATKEAEATECAAELGDNDKFWAYLDKIYQITPSNDGLDPKQLPIVAKDLGLDQKKFEACLASSKYADKIADQVAEANAAGGNGTPFPIIILAQPTKADLSQYEGKKTFAGEEEGIIRVTADRTRIVLGGALPTKTIDDIISKLLAN